MRLLVLFAGGIVLRVRTRLWHPLGGIVEAADRVAEGDFSPKVSVTGPPFLRWVASALQRHDVASGAAGRAATEPHGGHRARAPHTLAAVQGKLEG